MQTQIPWTTGGGYIVMDYNKGYGNDTILVSSSTMATDERQQNVVFRSGKDSSKTATLVVKQASSMTEETLTAHPSSFVSGSYASISGQTNPVGKDESSTSYATVNLTTGQNAQTTAFWKIDCSSIPSNATIKSVSCVAKAMTQQAGGNRVTTYEIQLYKGTATAKGSKTNLPTTAGSINISCGTWTRAELDDCNIRLYAVRGKNSTTTTYYLRFYGATLTVVYEYQGLTLQMQQDV